MLVVKKKKKKHPLQKISMQVLKNNVCIWVWHCKICIVKDLLTHKPSRQINQWKTKVLGAFWDVLLLTAALQWIKRLAFIHTNEMDNPKELERMVWYVVLSLLVVMYKNHNFKLFSQQSQEFAGINEPVQLPGLFECTFHAESKYDCESMNFANFWKSLDKKLPCSRH